MRPPAANVLLVEDNELVRECIAAILTEAGMCVTEVSNADEALALPDTAEAPRVLVTDMHLGAGRNGCELSAAARRRWPLIRVVVISGEDLSGRSFGSSETFLSKPFRSTVLVRLIRDLAAGWPASHAVGAKERG